MTDVPPRAVLSVSDKTGLVEFARGLVELGWELVSSGGTARALAEAGLPVAPVEAVTGFPEGLDGRVKTLHPAIHAGILFRRGEPSHELWMRERGLRAVDMVVVNLYPFVATVRERPGDLEAAVENIDIGGPSLLRAAAKNHAHVIVLCDPADYAPVLDELRAARRGSGPGLSAARRLQLAARAFRHTAAYDAAIARHFTAAAAAEEGAGSGEAVAGGGDGGGGDAPASLFPEEWTVGYERAALLRYGENPHQAAALYLDPLARGGLARARVLQGKALSYNNYVDAEAAWRGVWDFDAPACVAVKHLSPCGIATGDSPAAAFRAARACDPVSIFGGIVAFNRVVDEEAARAMADLFLEVLVAPGYDGAALALLAKKKNLRVLEQCPPADGTETRPRRLLVKAISGGALVQEGDALGSADRPEAWRVVTRRSPADDQLRALSFAWRSVRLVRSNAIVVALPDRTVGIGGGQTNRVDAVRQAIARAREALGLQGADLPAAAALASDAYFPFPDSIEEAAAAGIRAIVQPGGSVRDGEVIARADELGVAMCFTGRRHFLH